VFTGKERKRAIVNLADGKCVPCRGGSPPLTDAQIDELMPFVPGCQVKDVDGFKLSNKEWLQNGKI